MPATCFQITCFILSHTFETFHPQQHFEKSLYIVLFKPFQWLLLLLLLCCCGCRCCCCRCCCYCCCCYCCCCCRCCCCHFCCCRCCCCCCCFSNWNVAMEMKRWKAHISHRKAKSQQRQNSKTSTRTLYEIASREAISHTSFSMCNQAENHNHNS